MPILRDDVHPPFRPHKRPLRPGQRYRVQPHLERAGCWELAFQINRGTNVTRAGGKRHAPCTDLHGRQRAAATAARPADAFQPVESQAAIVQRSAKLWCDDGHASKRRHKAAPFEIRNHLIRRKGRLTTRTDAHIGQHRATRPQTFKSRLAFQRLFVTPLGECLLGDVLPPQPDQSREEQDQRQNSQSQPTPPFQALFARFRAIDL